MSRIIGSKPAAAQFVPLQEAEVARFLRRVLDDPGTLVEHIRKYVDGPIPHGGS